MNKSIIIALAFLASTAQAQDIMLNPQPDYVYLGVSCGGTHPSTYVTGFDANGNIKGEVYAWTRCGLSGRGGGYQYYDSWHSIIWDLDGNVLGSFDYDGIVPDTTFTETDAAGNTIYDVTISTPSGPVIRGMLSKPPSINGFWPGDGVPDSIVFVFGKGFVPNLTEVSVNGVQALIIQVIDDTLLFFQLPPGNTAGLIKVVTPVGQAMSSTSFGVPLTGLTITGTWPGAIKAGGVVFVFGQDFSLTPGANIVDVNGIPAPIVQPLESSLLFFFVPSGVTPGSGFVHVGVNGQTATSPAPLIILP